MFLLKINKEEDMTPEQMYTELTQADTPADRLEALLKIVNTIGD